MERIPNSIRKFGPVALLVLLLVIFQWHLILAWPPLLVCLLSLTVIVVGAYLLLQSRIVSIDKSLQDTHYERFRRLQGLYAAFAGSVHADPTTKESAAEFERQAAKLETLVDAKAHRFVSPDAENDVHSLYLIFLQIEPIDFLTLHIQTIESDYRQAAGAAVYLAYVGALLRNKPADPPWTPDQHARMLRADATFLVNETRRQDKLKQHIEHTRQRLLRSAFRSWWWNVIPLLAVLVIYLVCESWISLYSSTDSPQAGKKDAVQVSDSKTAVSPTSDSDQWKKSFVRGYLLEPGGHALEKPHQEGYTTLYQSIVMSALLALVGIAGASGGMMSVIQRIQSGTSDSDPATDLRALSLAETSVFFAPVSGLIFAIVLSLIFASRAINGTLFPAISPTGYWYYTLWDAPEMAKWMLWAFVAGFSERLVPDMLDTLTKQSEASGKTAGSPGATTTPVQPNLQGNTGDDANVKNDQRNAAVSDQGPVLDPHPDTIPSDATEFTVTGKNFDQDTKVYVNTQPKEVKERTASSLRVELADSDLQSPSIQVVARNPAGANAGDSNTLTISVGDPGE